MPKQVTMGWDEKQGCTVEQRTKEEANDYRYFPDPDLPILHFTQEYLGELKSKMPELPAQKRQRFLNEYGLPKADVENLIAWKEMATFFENVVSEVDEWMNVDVGAGIARPENGKPMASPTGRQAIIKQAVNWCLGEFSALLNQKLLNPADSRVDAENFAELLKMIQTGEISGSAGKQVFKVMFEKGGDPSNIVEDLGLKQVSDDTVIALAIDKVMTDNPKAVSDYKGGEQKSFGFLVGQTMKELKGKGKPQKINELLKQKLA
jgi:aspartyl-tRNA(Asn)/glutamyl-tRNA(Gln) amidotransferase subunit B